MQNVGVQVLARELASLISEFPLGLAEVADFGPLERVTVEASCASAELVRVVVFGEFNSGKSSLINGLLGHEVAPIDFLEKTAHVVRYFPHSEPIGVVHRRGPEAGDGPEIQRPGRVSAEFVDGLLSEWDSAEVTRVDLGLPFPGLFVLVDTPGIGAITVANQLLAMDGLREADAVLFCMAADSIGSSAEMGTAAALVERGMPVVIALTRCDQLGDQREVEEVRSWVAGAVKMDPSDVLPVGGLQAGGTPAGLAELSARLAAFGAEAREVKEQAEASQAALLLDEIRAVLEQVGRKVDAWQAGADRAAKLIRANSAAVEQKIRNRIAEDVETRLFQPRLEGVLRNPSSGVTEAAGEVVPTEADKEAGRAWAEITAQIPDMVFKEWRGQAAILRSDVEQLCAEAESQVAHCLATSFDPDAVMFAIQERGKKTFADSMALSVGTAAGTSAVVATVTGGSFFTALSGIGLPLAGAGFVISALVARRAQKRAQAQAALQLKQLLADLRAQFTDEVLEPLVFPQIHELNARIAGSLLDAAVQRVSPFASAADLSEASERLDAIRRRAIMDA